MALPLFRNRANRQYVLEQAGFFASLLNTAVPEKAAAGTVGTFTRATTKTWPNNDGNQVTGVAGEIGFVGARRVDNLIRLGAAQSSTLAVAANVTMTLPAGAYQFSMGAGTGTATFSGTGGATGTLASSASARTFVAKTISAGTLIVTASVATLIDIQVVSMVAETDQTTAREYVSVGVESAPYYHGSFVDGVKCFPYDLSGNPLPTAYTYDAVSLNGVAGTYVSTPDSVAASITGDIDIRVKVALTDWTPAGYAALTYKLGAAGQRSFYFAVVAGVSGNLEFAYSSNGTATVAATTTAGASITDGATSWVRVTYNSSTGKVNFYKSADGGTWSSVGTEVTVAAGSIFNSTTPVTIGSGSAGTTDLVNGKIYEAQIYNGIDGTLAVDFDASRYAGGTTLTGSTGETWTLNGSAVIHPTNNPNTGYSAEGARTNLQTHSNTAANWLASNATLSAVAGSDGGSSSAIRITGDATVAMHNGYGPNIAKAASAIQYTTSFIAKAGTSNFVTLFSGDGGGSGCKVTFNVSTGVITAALAQHGGTPFTLGTAGISSVGNGRYLVWASYTTNTAAALYNFVALSNDGTSLPSFNAAGVYVDVEGLQCEQGVSEPSSRIATTTVAVTRNADVEAVSTSGNIAAAAGSVYLEYTPTHTPSGTIAFWGTYVDASNYTAILHDATNLIFRKRIAGVNYDATIANAFVAGTTYKACATWGTSGTSITLNGTEGTPHANTTAAQIAATMQWGADGNSLQQPFASMRNCRDWLRQLSASERAAITS